MCNVGVHVSKDWYTGKLHEGNRLIAISPPKLGAEHVSVP